MFYKLCERVFSKNIEGKIVLKTLVRYKAKSKPTKRAPDAGDSAHIPSSFLRLIIFLAGRLRRPRPSAGNANRWLAAPKSKTKTVFDSQVSFCDWLRNS